MKEYSLWNSFIFFILLISAIGFFNVYSSTFYMNLESGANPYSHLIRHGIYFLIGSIAAGVIWSLPFSYCRGLGKMLVWAALILLVAVIFGGVSVNGARRWLNFAGVSLQPSEIAKVAAIMYTASGLAKLLEKKQPISLYTAALSRFSLTRWLLKAGGAEPRQPDSLLALYWPLFIPVLYAVLVEQQPDMGTAALIAGFPVLLYLFCGVPFYEIVLTVVFALVGFILLALAYPYRWERVSVLWDPFSYGSDAGYQTVQSLIAVGSGGFWGQGAGQGLSKFLYLPEQHTDFAYAVLSQEGGFLLAGAVMLLFAALLFTGFLMAGKIPQIFPALMVYGLTMLISMEGFLNMAMVIGVFPVTGVPLPFISFGGSALVMNLIAVGLIGNAVRYGKRLEAEKAAREKATPVSLREISGASFHVPMGGQFHKY